MEYIITSVVGIVGLVVGAVLCAVFVAIRNSFSGLRHEIDRQIDEVTNHILSEVSDINSRIDGDMRYLEEIRTELDRKIDSRVDKIYNEISQSKK